MKFSGKTYGVIYLTTCHANGKKYVGKKKLSDGWQQYYGSSPLLKKAVDRYGEDQFDREILQHCKNQRELDEAELEWILKLNALDDTNFYNVQMGLDQVAWTQEQRNEIIKRMSYHMDEFPDMFDTWHLSEIAYMKAKVHQQSLAK